MYFSGVISPIQCACVVALFSFSANLVACSEEEESSATVSYDADLQPVLDQNCGACHGEGNSSQDTLDLSPDKSKEAMVGVDSTQMDMKIVAPGDVDLSYLWHKLNASHLDAGGAGMTMPPGGVLSADDLELFKTWIEEGAA